ncbi:MAG: nitrophenyl compound nitroreductase subunit ArsF family protein [Rikenellaceae bacterium]|nr:nitrophenyl compound nitroreductase subunit ArsF family protein [Rikenellaceae bacterium]
MNKLILAFTLSLGLTACGRDVMTNGDTAKTELQETSDRVEILCFHSKRRCATCMAIEKNAKEAVETQFADELKDGTVVFRSVDISKPENEKIAEKYGVTWSSLFISKWKDGRETYENMTEYAFAKARTSPDTFKSVVIEKVNALLK